MRVIFCADPLNGRNVDDAYRGELDAVTRVDPAAACLLRFEQLVDDRDPDGAVRRIPAAEPPAVGVYRGWMLAPEHYTALYAALSAKGVRLLNSPDEYRHCHHLPEWYPILAEHTPLSVWISAEAAQVPDSLSRTLAPFGSGPLVLKDYVKSRKHEWKEACFIPAADDRTAVGRVVSRFLELQDHQVAGGLVFREFVPLRAAGLHPQSGMPLAQEYRLFFLDGQCLAVSEYWSTGTYTDDERPPIAHFAALATRVQSRFFTMDVALRNDGRWMIVELGDAQVAELSEGIDATAFYRRLTEGVDRVGHHGEGLLGDGRLL